MGTNIQVFVPLWTPARSICQICNKTIADGWWLPMKELQVAIPAQNYRTVCRLCYHSNKMVPHLMVDDWVYYDPAYRRIYKNDARDPFKESNNG